MIRCKEKTIHSKSSKTLRDVAQRDYRICILGDVQTQLKRGPDLSKLILNLDFGWDAGEVRLQKSFPPKTILELYDFINYSKVET